MDLDKHWDLYLNHLNRAVSPAHAAELEGVYGENLAQWTAYSESTLAVPIKPVCRKPSEKWLIAIRLKHHIETHPQNFTQCETCGETFNHNYIGTHRRKKH